MNEFIQHYYDYYNIPIPEESDDPFFDELTSSFDFFANKLSTYRMTYADMRMYTDKSPSYLHKKIPLYVDDNKLIRYGSKNSAEFVLPKYEPAYLNSKKVEPLADLRSFINPTIYIDKLQLRLVPCNVYGNTFFSSKYTSKPTIMQIKKNPYSSNYVYRYLFHKNGSIIIYVNFESESNPITANIQNFTRLFDILRKRLMSKSNSTTTLPHSFIISQFKGYREPFNKSSKIPVNINQSFNLPDLLHHLTSSY